LNYKLLTILFLFLIFDFEPKKFLDEKKVSFFYKKIKNIKHEFKAKINYNLQGKFFAFFKLFFIFSLKLS